MLNSNGKTCVITGVTSGIGEQTAIILASKGFNVIGIGRYKKRCEKTLEKINTISNSSKILICDLSDQTQIKLLTEKIKKEGISIDILINNAGGIFLKRILDKQNIEMTWSVNYLSHFLLTGLLVKNNSLSNNSKIINVSSIAHEKATINFEDISFTKGYNGMKAYGQSKLAMLMWSYTLAKKLQNKKISVSSVHPGIIGTRLLSNNGFISPLLNLGLNIVGRNAKWGAENIINTLNSTHTNHCDYYHEKKIVESSIFSNNIKYQDELWKLSEKNLNFTFNN